MSGPEDNPADDHKPTKEEWDRAMSSTEAGAVHDKVDLPILRALAHDLSSKNKNSDARNWLHQAWELVDVHLPLAIEEITAARSRASRPEEGAAETMTRAEVEELMATKLPCGHPEACAIMHDPQGARISCGWRDAVREWRAKCEEAIAERERASRMTASHAATSQRLLDELNGERIARKKSEAEAAEWRGRAEAKWVAMKDQLPEDNASVLWCRVPVDEPPQVLSMCDEEWPEMRDYFTHWQPLPAPPTDGDGDGKGGR